MPLAAGTRLGPYEILSVLGAGGMGEVYRARDTRLGRDVAIKVLTEQLVATPEIRARFEREAKTISQLSHPNICALYDVGRAPGVAGAPGIDYLVMELVEGETLASRLARGALPAAEVLALGGQIAGALEQAHRAGVIHRDLKPGNVMLTRSGAKLMDFGLARAAGMAGPAGDSGVTAAAMSQSPTVAQPLTAEGTIVGTFQYMSPEQLEGRDADARSDIWALGCLLYEMSTGRRAFEGRSQASLISAIMSGEPDPVSQLVPLAPPTLDRVIRACLAKDPEDRIQTAHDVRLQLQWERESASDASAAGRAAPGARRRGWIPWAVTAAALIAALATWIVRVPAPGRTGPVRAVADIAPGITPTAYGCDVTISPDGHAVAFVAVKQRASIRSLWIRPLDGAEARQIDLPGEASWPFWSPDGRFMGYFDQSTGKLMKVPVDGGRAAEVCDAPNGRGGTWNAGDVIVFAPAPAGPLMRVRASGGTPQPVTRIDSTRSETAHRFPCFLPDGRHFTYAALPRGRDGAFEIYIGSLDGGNPVHLMRAESAPVFAAPGYLLFRRGAQVMAQRFDSGRRALEGEPVAIGDAPELSDLDADPVVSASRNGRLALLATGAPDNRLEELDRSGVTMKTFDLPRAAWSVLSVTRDERRALLGNGDGLWFFDLERSVPTQFRSTGSTPSGVISPDGRQVAFVNRKNGREGIAVADLAGTIQYEIYPNDLFKSVYDWSPDGAYVVYGQLDPQTGYDILLLPTAGDHTPVRLINGPNWEMSAKVSPDGHWIAYSMKEPSSLQIYVTSFPRPGLKVRVTRDGGALPRWGRGGRELYYLASRALHAVPMRPGEEPRPGNPTRLFALDALPSGGAVMQDGDRFLVAVDRRPGRRVRLVLNWTALVER